MNKNYDYKRLTPFKWFVLQNFPFIDEDFDAITNYQLFCKLGEEINKLIESMNLAGEQVEELTNYVNNFFDNLDVQDEINNKLDEMAESGQLTDIIAQYLQLAGLLCFNTVADMKNATNLINGSFAKTLGYHFLNDGGTAIYKIRTVTNEDIIDEGSVIALNDNTLIAELITDIANVKLFGAYGDNIHDDTISISNAMLYARTKSIAVYFPKGKYIVTDSLPNMDAGSIIYGDESIGNDGDYGSQIIDNRTTNRQWLFQYYQADSTNLRNQRGTTIRNIAFISPDENNENTKWLINIRYIFEDLLIENVYIRGYERVIYANDTNYFTFRNIRCIKIGSYTNNETKYYAFELEGIFGTLFDNVQTDETRYLFKITTRNGGTLGSQCRFQNCHFEQTPNFHCVSSSVTDSMIYIDTGYTQQFSNCMFVPADSGDYSSNAPYMIYAGSRILVDNCYFVGAYTNNRKARFIKGIAQITNCQFTNCSNNALNLSESSIVSNSRFTYFANQDLTTYEFIIKNDSKSIPKCIGNSLDITLSGITKLTIPIALFMFYQPYSLTSTDSKYLIAQNYQISDKWKKMFKIQKTYADFSLKRPFKIKAYSLVNGSTFYYEGIFKVNNDGTLTKVQTICQNGIANYPIDIWYKDDILYIQLSFINSWTKIEIEDLENCPLTAFLDATSPDITGYSHLYINS
jgi:hypothetical protein